MRTNKKMSEMTPDELRRKKANDKRYRESHKEQRREHEREYSNKNTVAAWRLGNIE